MLILKRIVLLLLFFSASAIYSQEYKKVDTIVSKYPNRFNSPTKLAKRISNDFKTELQQARAVYFWIANNVSYDPNESGKFGYEYGDWKEYLKKEKKHNSKLSSRVISKGIAVCEGYATLFTEVCNHLNIKSKVISGASRTETKDIGKRFYSSHAWNIVIIDKKPYLLDVTWGAGSYGTKFKKNVNDFYFLTPPELFINKHYPENYKDALLDEKISKESFSNAPLLYKQIFPLIYPNNGILKKEQKIIKLAFKCKPGSYAVDYDLDKKQHSLMNFKCINNKIEFEVDISNSMRARELTIFLDYQTIAKFSLK